MPGAALHDLDVLRRYLETRARWIAPSGGVLASGIAALDRVLDGGFPRGAISVLTGPAGAGRMTIAASLLASESRAESAVAWVDAKETLYPPALALAGCTLDRVLVVKSRAPRVVSAIEQILSSGAFSAVVASGFEAELNATRLRRFQTAAENASACCVLILDRAIASSITNASLRLRVTRRSPGIQAEIEKHRTNGVGRRAYFACVP